MPFRRGDGGGAGAGDRDGDGRGHNEFTLPTPTVTSHTSDPIRPRPGVTVQALVDHLVQDAALIKGPQHLNSVLGRARHNLDMPKLEDAILRAGLCSPVELVNLKAELAGREPYEDNAGWVPDLRFDVDTSHTTGAIAVTRPGETGITIAMVEDHPDHIAAVTAALNNPHFAIIICLTKQWLALMVAAHTRSVVVHEAPTPHDLFDLLDDAITLGSSDIHLQVHQPPQMRIDGDLRRLDGSLCAPNRAGRLPAYSPLSQTWLQTQLESIFGSIMGDLGHGSLDTALIYGERRFRVNIAQNSMGLSLVLRALPTSIPTYDDLALAPAIRRLARLRRGLVLVTGPTGSGKSTTLAALVNDIACHTASKIITLEDPQEFDYPKDAMSSVEQREKGKHFPDYHTALRAALRQDPDVILVGEMRDFETIEVAVTAAETGHLVLSTTHTKDAATTIDRLVGAYPERSQPQARAQLASVLQGVVSQMLLPRIGGGRVAAQEIMICTDAVRNNLRKEGGGVRVKQTIGSGFGDGSRLMDYALAQLVIKRLVTMADARSRCVNEGDFDAYLTSAFKS